MSLRRQTKMDKKLEKLKEEYKNIPIPDELDFVVEKALKQKQKKNPLHKWVIGAVAAVALLMTGINTSPAMAHALADIPVVGNVIKVLTFVEYKVAKDDKYEADIKVPAITELKDEKLANLLNEKYLKEGEELYKDFIRDMEEIEENGGGHFGVASGYEIKTDNEKILSIGRYVVQMAGSSSTVMKYDTIDKENEILLSLPMLFADESYVPIISEYIKEQMREEMKDIESGKIYWVTEAGLEDESLVETFDAIKVDQNFYINEDGKLVISFDKYEVAPGYMGLVEFVIPTEILSDLLISNEFIN